MAKYVIVGNSAGAIGAVEAIRQVDKEGSIVILSEEPYPVYSRPMISEYLAGEAGLDQMLYRPKDFYTRNQVETVLGRKVVSLDLANKQAKLDDGAAITWEKLLLATGGVPFVPRTPGQEKEGVYTFTTLDDAKRIRERIGQLQRVVVIGGGLIGMSVTEALTKLKAQVTVVELKERVLNLMLDEEGSRRVEAALAQRGVEVVVNNTVREIVGREDNPEAVGGVLLNDGRQIPCDAVIAAIGVIPRTELAAGTEIKVNRGIVVDRHMATSVPDVYACGDVCEGYDFVIQTNRVVPIWPSAYMGGRVAGFNMAGGEAEFSGGTSMNSLKYFGLSIISGGVVSPEASQDYEILTQVHPENGVYKKVVLKDDVVMGLIFFEDIDKAGIVYGLMRDKTDVSAFKSKLLTENFGFISFPKEMRKQRLGVG
ncbi:MAG: NAD(P)/FAD-dependent oxidoreductase [Chloroflexota bacterium]|nr:MAG: NAD(P)/FAD-dependent oxidoreductase [Chloroflexota bacterium]